MLLYYTISIHRKPIYIFKKNTNILLHPAISIILKSHSAQQKSKDMIKEKHKWKFFFSYYMRFKLNMKIQTF